MACKGEWEWTHRHTADATQRKRPVMEPHLEPHMLLSCTFHALAASSQEGRQETQEST